VAPTRMLDDAGETDTVATGTTVAVVTERGAVPVAPSLEAAIWVVPAPSAVTTPESETVATVTLLDVQTTARPVSTLLLESRSVSVA